MNNDIILNIMNKSYCPATIEKYMTTDNNFDYYVRSRKFTYRLCDEKWHKYIIMKICMEKKCENESLKKNDYCYYCCRKDKVTRKISQLYEIVPVVEKLQIQLGYWHFEIKYITSDTFERVYQKPKKNTSPHH